MNRCMRISKNDEFHIVMPRRFYKQSQLGEIDSLAAIIVFGFESQPKYAQSIAGQDTCACHPGAEI